MAMILPQPSLCYLARHVQATTQGPAGRLASAVPPPRDSVFYDAQGEAQTMIREYGTGIPNVVKI